MLAMEDDDLDLWAAIADEALLIEQNVMQSRVGFEIGQLRPPPRPAPPPAVSRRIMSTPSGSANVPTITDHVTHAAPAAIFMPSASLPVALTAAAVRPPPHQLAGGGGAALLLGEDTAIVAQRQPLTLHNQEANVRCGRAVRNGGAGDDSFSRVLREKDAELKQLRLEKEGEIANLRHRMRALSSQLEARTFVPTTQPPANDQLLKMTEERNRLAKDVAIADTDLKRVSEQLSFSRHEVSVLQDKERMRVAAAAAASAANVATRSAATEFPDPGTLGAGPSTSAAGPQRPLHLSTATQGMGLASEFVENTQFGGALVKPSQSGGYEMPRGPRRPRRRRPVSAGDPASSTMAENFVFSSVAATAEGTQGTSPSQFLPRAILSVEEMPPPLPAKENDAYPAQKRHQMPKRPRTPDWGPEVQIVLIGELGCDGDGDSVASTQTQALRDALFGGDRAEQLLYLCTYLGNYDLRRAISRAMASDQEWTALLAPLGELLSPIEDVEYAAAALSLGLASICALVEHNRSCRVVLATEGKFCNVLGKVIRTLEASTDSLDSSLACLALRVLSCVVSEVSLLQSCGIDDAASGHASKMDKATFDYAVDVRRRLEHEAVLLWLQQRDSTTADACCVAAEISCDLIMNIVGSPAAQEDQREGDFLEQAVLCFAAALPVLSVNERVKSLALCSLDWTSQVAPYLFDEKDARVMENLCLYTVEVVHRLRLNEVLRADSRRSFCELVVDAKRYGQRGQHVAAVPECWESDEEHSGDEDETSDSVAGIALAVSIARRLVQRGGAGSAHAGEVSQTTRNVALGALCFLGWPPTDDVGAQRTRYPAIPALSSNKSLASDARILYDALARTDPDGGTS
jgi:hypothetical protein